MSSRGGLKKGIFFGPRGPKKLSRSLSRGNALSGEDEGDRSVCIAGQVWKGESHELPGLEILIARPPYPGT